jgi:hypothetical protein
MKQAIVSTLMLGLAAFGGAAKKRVAALKLVITPGMKAAKQVLGGSRVVL